MKLITALLLTVVAFPVLADRVVNGYVKRDGTVVQPHVKTESNRTRSDNYSTQGNKNPYTGKSGSERADGDYPSSSRGSTSSSSYGTSGSGTSRHKSKSGW